MAKILRAELSVAAPRDDTPLRACGLIAVNPPWTLERELQTLLPELAKIVASDGGGGHRLGWLAGEP